MKKLIRLGIVALTIAMLVILFSAQENTAQTIPTRVEAVYRATASTTGIPLRVPSLIPLTSPAAPAEYWASSIAPSPERYIISFDRAEDCTNVEECSFAMAKGELDAETAIPNSKA